MLPGSPNSVQVQRWRAPISPYRQFWWFFSSAGLLVQRKKLRLSHVHRTRRVSMAPATSLCLYSDLSSVPRDGVSEAEGTLLLFWMMKYSSSYRNTWSQARTGGLGWHLQLQTSRLTPLLLRVSRVDSMALYIYIRFIYLYWFFKSWPLFERDYIGQLLWYIYYQWLYLTIDLKNVRNEHYPLTLDILHIYCMQLYYVCSLWFIQGLAHSDISLGQEVW